MSAAWEPKAWVGRPQRRTNWAAPACSPGTVPRQPPAHPARLPLQPGTAAGGGGGGGGPRLLHPCHPWRLRAQGAQGAGGAAHPLGQDPHFLRELTTKPCPAEGGGRAGVGGSAPAPQPVPPPCSGHPTAPRLHPQRMHAPFPTPRSTTNASPRTTQPPPPTPRPERSSWTPSGRPAARCPPAEPRAQRWVGGGLLGRACFELVSSACSS